jgi:hypothetical protein
VYQPTAGGRARQLAAIPFELTIHQDVLHAPRRLVGIGKVTVSRIVVGSKMVTSVIMCHIGHNTAANHGISQTPQQFLHASIGHRSAIFKI